MDSPFPKGPRHRFPRWDLLVCSVMLGAAGVLVATDQVQAVNAPPSSRLRLLIETDAGGDPDDEQSLVRFLLYANEWDVEGIVANRPDARPGENLNPERTGLGIVRALVRAYGRCWTNLVTHDSRYPEPGLLMSRTVPGYDDTDDAVNLILRAVDSPDPRPLWYSDWGSDRGAATNNLRRALDRVLRERGSTGYARFKNRLRLASYDKFAEHTATEPGWTLWINTWQPELDRQRWYHRFSALTSKAGGFDLSRDVLAGHGPLGALYPTNTSPRQKEGDSASFLYLVPTGMNDPSEPNWGSWAGRYGARPDHPGHPYYWADQMDTWHGTTHRDNTLLRWAEAFQNDFRARLDWCVKTRREANHPPRVMLNGADGTEVLRFSARAGERVTLDAAGSADPDGQALRFEWFLYPEAGTYRGEASLEITHATRSVVTLPADAAGHLIHVVVAATDAGSPALTRYRRAVIEVTSRAHSGEVIAPFLHVPGEWEGRLSARHSPTALRDGSKVTQAADWPRRREEILRSWHTLMGPWPDVLDNPRLEVLSTSRRDNFVQQRIRLETAPGQRGDGWLLIPDGPGPHPAVVVVFYDPETSVGLDPSKNQRDFALQLARRGFVTLSLGTPGGDAWHPDLAGAGCQPLSFHAYVAANAWQALSHLPRVDASRIGIVGHSYGGKWALFAAAFWEKFAAVAVSDPGIVFDETRSNINYWEPWYLGLDSRRKREPGLPTEANPRTGAYARMVELGLDLTEVHALISPRPFLVSGGAEDPPSRWMDLNHSIALNSLLGSSNRVALTSRKSHDPDGSSNEQLYSFFDWFLGGP